MLCGDGLRWPVPRALRAASRLPGVGRTARLGAGAEGNIFRLNHNIAP
jgi:hypothetical protein